MNARVRTAILISGGGSNMETLVRAAQDPDYPAEIVLVICNRPKAGGIARAKGLGVPVTVLDHKNFKTREAFEHEMDTALRARKVELICNAGFMRLLTPWFVKKWRGRQLNIHPSLLPKYKGLHTHQRALDAGDLEHGCTIHYVSEGMDEGEIVAQARVPVLDGDTPDTLSARVLIEEHKLYPLTLETVAEKLRH